MAMGFLISGDDTLRTLALRWTQIVRKIYFGGSNFLKVNNLGPVAGFFQSSALPTELLGHVTHNDWNCGPAWLLQGAQKAAI